MTVFLPVPRPAVLTGTIIMADDTQPPASPEVYKDIIDQNAHLRTVLKALLKERRGQTLTESERHAIDLHIAAQKWQLEHTNMESS